MILYLKNWLTFLNLTWVIQFKLRRVVIERNSLELTIDYRHFPQNDAEAAREAYTKFLERYPYCYGYWRKFADYEKKKGNPENVQTVSPIVY